MYTDASAAKRAGAAIGCDRLYVKMLRPAAPATAAKTLGGCENATPTPYIIT